METKYLVGGKVFNTLELAIAHATKVFKTKGIILGIESV